MNILFIMNTYPDIGGVSSVTNILAGYLGDYRKHNVYSLAAKKDDNILLPEGIKEAFVYESKDKKTWPDYYNSLIDRLDIDIVINQGMYSKFNRVIFNKKRNANVKIISTLHGMPGYDTLNFWSRKRTSNPVKKFYRKILKALHLHYGYHKCTVTARKNYRKATELSSKVVLLTNSYIPEFIQKYNLHSSAGKIVAINNPIHTEYTRYAVPQLKDKEKIVLYVGRLAHEKRIDLILDAWDLLHKEYNADGIMNDWHLIIVGDGPQKKALMNKASLQQRQNITFAGEIKNPAPYYSKARITLLASEFEGFPMCLLEAQRLGCVPISFNSSSGIADILSGDSGVIVPKHDIAGMASNILKFIKDENLLEEYYSRAIRKSEAYDIGHIGPQWDAIIEELVK